MASELCAVPEPVAKENCVSSWSKRICLYWAYVDLVAKVEESSFANETEPLPNLCPYATENCTDEVAAVL